MADLPKAIICDLDGSLALIGPRNPYDAAKCEVDTLNWPVAATVHALRNAGYRVIFMSGRKECDRKPTVDWIRKNMLSGVCGWVECVDYELFMRETDDNRPDNVVKVELFEKYVKPRYDVLLTLDDRKKVVRAWRDALGLVCLQVNDGPLEKTDCIHCGGSGTSKALVGDEQEAALALCDLVGKPSWEPHLREAEYAIKSIIKAVSKGRAR
jgi:hypothetical protein